VICTCDQCDSAFRALKLTAPTKPKWCVLYCCACLHPYTILMEAGWTTVPRAATNLSILICKSSARTKQSVIGVALKTPLEIRLWICIYKTSFLHRPDVYIGFIPSCPPHILQQNCAHDYVICNSAVNLTGFITVCHNTPCTVYDRAMACLPH